MKPCVILVRLVLLYLEFVFYVIHLHVQVNSPLKSTPLITPNTIFMSGDPVH